MRLNGDEVNLLTLSHHDYDAFGEQLETVLNQYDVIDVTFSHTYDPEQEHMHYQALVFIRK